MSKVLDVRGERCPEPIVKVARVLEDAVDGQEVRVLTDNEECVHYISDLVKVAGIGTINVVRKEGHYELIILVEHAGEP